MHHRLHHAHFRAFSWHYLWSEALLAVVMAALLLATPASAAMRLQERSLLIYDTAPAAITTYDLKFRYMSPQSVASVSLLFCIDPIPYHECVTPPGLDVSNATLTSQLGEIGYTISSRTNNQLVLTRPLTAIASPSSIYKFENVKNPTDVNESFSIRIRTHATPDASGPQIDFGSVKGQVGNGIIIQTQVPPMLIFCLAQVVSDNCADTNDVYYTDMGTLTTENTLVAQSQMAVGTNASGGFAITAIGEPPSAGINVINPIPTPRPANPGVSQFGINLVQNTAPAVGRDPEGDWANAIAAPDYSIPNQYKFVSGDVVAYSPNVSLMKKFTVSYILNAGTNLRAGVYSTTVNFIASGRF